MLEDALTARRDVADPMAILRAAPNLADPALAEGSLEDAKSLIAESLQLARVIRYSSALAMALALDALLALHRDDLDHASDRINESLDVVRAAYHVMSAVTLLTAAATLAAARNDPLRAAQLWSAFDSSMARVGADDTCDARRLREKWLPQARQLASATAWQNAWEAGAKLTPRQALDLVDTQAPISHTARAVRLVRRSAVAPVHEQLRRP